MRVRTWFLATLALALLAGGCGKKDRDWETPLHRATARGDIQKVQELIARGANVNAGDNGGWAPLHLAARGGHMEVVRLLLRCGAQVDLPDEEGRTPAMVAMMENRRAVVEYLVSQRASLDLHLAAYLGDVAAVQRLINAGADVQERLRHRYEFESPHNWTPLHYAAFSNQVAIAELLLAAGSNVNEPGGNQETPLHVAVERQSKDMVRLLLAQGADVNGADEGGNTPLHEAADANSLDLVRVLLAAGADVAKRNRSGATPFHLACVNEWTQVAEELIAGGADPDVYEMHRYRKERPLEDAIQWGRLDMVDLLLRHGADVNGADEGGWTPLHHAIVSAYYHAVRTILDTEYNDVNATDWERREAVTAAVRARVATETARRLITYHANVRIADKDGLTPLHLAACDGLEGLVELLIAEGADVNARRTGGEPSHRMESPYYGMSYDLEVGATPLHAGAVGQDPNVVEVLVSGGALLNAQDALGRTPLHYASRRESTEIVQLLIAGGADVNAGSQSGATPLVEALHAGRVAVARSLIAAGAKRVTMKDYPAKEYIRDRWVELPLLHRILEGYRARWETRRGDANDLQEGGLDWEWIELFLENGGDVNERDDKGNTPLHVIVLLRNEELVRLVVAHGADVGAENNQQITPLHYAASTGSEALVVLFLDKGADVNAQDNDGDTPLHGAALHGHAKAVELLLAHGADGSVKNSRGRTPLDEAVRRGHTDVIQVLKAHQGAQQGFPRESEK